MTDQKRAILEAFHDQKLTALLTDQGKEAQVHVIPLGHIQAEVFYLNGMTRLHLLTKGFT